MIKTVEEVRTEAKKILAIAEERKEKLEEARAEAVQKRDERIRQADEFIKNGETAKYSKAKTEAEALKARTDYLNNELAELKFMDLEAEIREVIESIRQISNEANRKIEDIYFRAWTEGLKAEATAEKIRIEGNGLIWKLEALIGQHYHTHLSKSFFAGMLKPSENEIIFVEAWKRLRRRRKKEKQEVKK